jgi:hypothetical protein
MTAFACWAASGPAGGNSPPLLQPDNAMVARETTTSIGRKLSTGRMTPDPWLVREVNPFAGQPSQSSTLGFSPHLGLEGFYVRTVLGADRRIALAGEGDARESLVSYRRCRTAFVSSFMLKNPFASFFRTQGHAGSESVTREAAFPANTHPLVPHIRSFQATRGPTPFRRVQQ